MSDDGERTDDQNELREQGALPDPVDLNARREERRQAANSQADPYQLAYDDLSDELERQADRLVYESRP